MIEGATVALRSTDAGFLSLVRDCLGQYRVEEAVSEHEALFSADCGIERRMPGGKVVRGKLTLYFGTMPIFGGRNLEQMAGRFVGFIRDTATRASNEYLRVRAAAVSLNGSALVLPSPPTPRLPTLAGLLARGGGDYLGDELINIDPILHRIHPAGLPLLIDAEDLNLFPEIPPPSAKSRVKGSEWARSAMQRHPVLPEALGSRFSEPVTLGWVVFPEFKEGAEARLEPVNTADAIFRFTQACMNLHVWEDRALILIRNLLEETPASRLVMSSPKEGVDLIRTVASRMMKEVRA
jgi:hypothetical protein